MYYIQFILFNLDLNSPCIVYHRLIGHRKGM